VIELPSGSTPLDFAFKIHSDIGARCVGAKVNGKIVPIDYILENGEIIEIITSNNSKGPSIDWLQIAKSSNARSKIRQWLKRQDKSQNIDKGRELLEKTVKRKGLDVKDFVRNTRIVKIAKNMNYASVDDLYTSLSYGGAIVSKVIGQLQEIADAERALAEKDTDAEALERANKRSTYPAVESGSGDVIVEGVSNMLVHLSKCCSPVPGDEIIGFVTKGRGLSVHRTDCPNIINLPEQEKGRLMPVSWNIKSKSGMYEADITIVSDDRKGLFSDISKKCLDLDVNISGVNLRTNNDGSVTILMTLSISNTNQMEKSLRSLKQVESVTDVFRART
ncbi:MAG: TGS domain-containing protein, partial [Clostridiales Family XIII bacterium]|nr:TGS domain-containing protein [Clostridiales Family XIII bacterium]